MPETKERKYRVIIPGKCYSCAECSQVFQGGNCRNLAARCFDSHQGTPEPGREFRPNPHGGNDHLKRPGDGEARPDLYGRWRQGKPGSLGHRRVEINKALYQAGNREREVIRRFLNEYVNKPIAARRKISPLRRFIF